MNRVVGTSVFLVPFRCRDFSIFFVASAKTHISEWVTFFLLDVFKHFLFLFAYLCFVFLLVFVFVLLVRTKSFRKKIVKRFKVALMTSFPLLLTAWKVSVFGFILVRIFLHSDWIRRDTQYLRIQSECGKMSTRITPNTDIFYAVMDVGIIWWVITPCPTACKNNCHWLETHCWNDKLSLNSRKSEWPK